MPPPGHRGRAAASRQCQAKGDRVRQGDGEGGFWGLVTEDRDPPHPQGEPSPEGHPASGTPQVLG